MKTLKISITCLALFAITIAFGVYGSAQQAPSVDATMYGGIYAYSFGLQNADAEVVGDTVWHLSAESDYDSSLTFNAIPWDNIYVQARFRGGGTSFGEIDTNTNLSEDDKDSGNVEIYVMGSLDGSNWTLVDSVSVTDTVWTFGVITWTKWPWCKFVVHGRGKIDSSGAAGYIRAGAYGVK